MAGRRAIKAVNWASLAERIPESEKNTLAAFKAKYDQYFRSVQQYPENPPKLDWAFYKKSVPVSGLVDKFQKEYESLKINYPEDKYTAQIDAQAKDIEAHIKKFIEESNQRIVENEQEIKKLEGLLKYGQMTMEDFRDAHPDIALDPINNPTMWPHTPEVQPSEDDAKEAQESSH
ncbi:hypothetical protein QAD02_018182 [Eretmocerus hayati]|uniref:Uncharacterized protein n=1 Tax=Eretmocerus hayati TaxID=131215 RepID=A0ACC2PFN3_9HYME|nr:hypothetical protein QAD02_018182 [Eretmocerus hayati]